MNWQFALVGLIVAAAVAYLLRQCLRTWAGSKAGCAGGCGCAAKKPRSTTEAVAPSGLISADDLTARWRRRRS